MMNDHTLSDRQLLAYYLQTLNNAETQQIRHYSQWDHHNYTKEFKDFIAEQKERTQDQHSVLNKLENLSSSHAPGETCEPVQGMLREVEKISQFSQKNADLLEPVVAQLLHCIKHYELVTYQAALVLARNLEEMQITTALTEIVTEEEQAYLQLQNFVVVRRQNEKVAADTEIGE